jgi:hypothetical protein
MLRSWRQAIRYFLFPDSRRIDERTKEIDRQMKGFKQQKEQTHEIVKHANQPDILRNLVISMTRDQRNG